MYIYMIKNQLNGKRYIGQTTQSIKKRLDNHFYCCKSSSYPLHLAIKKYGRENFIWSIVEECRSMKELNYQEEMWIKEFNTLAPGGYNLKPGGNNHTCHINTKKKISESNKGNKSHYGKPHSQEAKRKISKANLGKKRTDEQKQRMSVIMQGKACRWMKNRPCPKKTKIKLSLSLKRRWVIKRGLTT